MIRTEMRDDRGEIRQLTENDPEYWTGPYVYQPFPKLLFRIAHPGQTEPDHCVVKSEREMSDKGSGWCESPDEARAFFNKLEADVARAAAEANAADRQMSDAAKAERLAYERSTDEMVTEVPRKRGRPKKPAVPAVE